MFPAYRCADSYPHQRNQMPFTQFYHPGLEAVPPQMRMDPAKFPVSYELSWPYGCNYGYPSPFHACCNHSYFPGYYNCQPPYPHFSPPLPFHCQAYPVQYVPPPHSSMEQPRYEFDKNVAGNHHCCGCPNHMGNWSEDKNAKIEEHEPDNEKRGSNSLAPTELKNCPYPIVWIPPGYLKNKDHGKPFESEVKDGQESSKSLEPCTWNGWFPFDMNGGGSLKQGGDGKRIQSRQDGDKMGQFPLPIIWMPSHDKPEEIERMGHKESNAAPKSAEELPSNFEIIPLEFPDNNDDSTEKLKDKEENHGDQVGAKMMEKDANRESTPLKQMEPHREMKTTSVDGQGKTKVIPVKHVKDKGLKKPSESNARRQSSSPPKMSKLPPVCLRVDPLPRRKNGSGGSRSPSPPGHKGNSQEISNEKLKASASTSPKENTQQVSQALNCAASNSKEVDPSKKEIKVIEVTEKIGGQRKNKDLKSGAQSEIQSQAQIPSGDCKVEGKRVKAVGNVTFEEAKKVADTVQSGDGDCKIIEDERASEAKVEKYEDLLKAEKRNLSDAEAAVIIQSAYRGFEVRKWEPLKKLKQIAEVRDQVVEVRSRIHALESSSDLHRDDKQRMIIGETIMSLLLKLDTIQGLHQSLRDIRKSVARELTNLQEKLDSLTIQEEELSEVPTIKNVEGCVDTQDNVCMQEGQDKEAKEVGSGDGQPLRMTDAISGSQDKETLETILLDGVNGEYENNVTERLVASNVEPRMAAPEPIIEAKEQVADEKLDGSQAVMMEMQKANSEAYFASELEHSVELPLVEEEKATREMESTESLIEDNSVGEGKLEVAEVDDLKPLDKDSETNQLAEMPKGVVSEDPAVLEFEKDGMVEPRKEEVIGGGEVEQVETGEIGVLHGGNTESNLGINAALQNNRTPDMNQLEQQPQEVLEEGLLTEKLEDYVKANAQNEEEVRGLSKLKIEAVQSQEEDVNHGKELAEVPEAEEAQPMPSLTERESHDEEQEEAVQLQQEDGSCDIELAVSAIEEAQPVFSLAEKDANEEQEEGQGISIVDQAPSSGHTNIEVTSQEKEVPIEETKGENLNEPVAIGVKDERMVEKVESQVIECETGDAMLLGQPNDSRNDKDEALLGTQFDRASEEQVDDQENVTESDRKLIEENKQLREMMEKLLEAGKEQLTFISNLSGRVKDLERKLSRKKKKLGARRSRAATSGSSCVKPSHNSLK